METEQDSRTLESLGKALAALSAKLEPKDVQPGVAALLRFLEDANEHQETLVHVWLELEWVAKYGDPVRENFDRYVKVHQFPLMIGRQRRAVLDGLEKLTGEKFEGDLWRFVNWATPSGDTKPRRPYLSSGRPYIIGRKDLR
jgi:hypothetical protein